MPLNGIATRVISDAPTTGAVTWNGYAGIGRISTRPL
jgi:hypothetical protein